MVLSGTLRVVLLCLLSLCLRGTEAQLVDQNNLARIIRHIQTRYSPGGQYAVAINIPRHLCTGRFSYEELRNALNNDQPNNVRNNLRNNSIYNGQRMIAATRIEDPNNIDQNTTQHPFFHSEYLLLINSNPLGVRPNVPLMQALLNRDPQGCVIFYTYNSPCTGTCLKRNRPRNILTALNMIRRRPGPKAFVYNRIFQRDQGNPQLGVRLRQIEGNNNNRFLYRCNQNVMNPHYTCRLCFNGATTDPDCLNLSSQSD
ncbi:uncharacterized protein LOC108411132 [Pygocentrus nattereri]|uniref:uncharacterized protein LOC108411132 n=1 Tax=Pygocentrus nattereri TaxID=42514 RepID=UPI0008142D25|nr:uncharacterized protein LOC108411132 [Pygocentrus nattereri]